LHPSALELNGGAELVRLTTGLDGDPLKALDVVVAPTE
jgi:hypothetical protein